MERLVAAGSDGHLPRDPAMTDEFDDATRRSDTDFRGRGRRESSWGDDEPEGLSHSERDLRAAHAEAERKTKLAGDVLWFVVVSALLLRFLPPIGIVVFIVWGLKLGKRWYRREFEPRLRRRFVVQEVEKKVHATLSQQRRALEGEHSRSLEQLSASIAHDIRNPITAAKSLVQQMGERPGAPENAEYARVALDELRRVERSVSHLLRFARDEEVCFAELRMADVVESALESFRDRAERLGIDVDRQVDCEAQLLGDAEQLRRVVINLVGNAFDALDETATVDPRIVVHLGENLAGTEVWLRIEDNGPGIDDATRARMFDPFFTSKANGTGLGLAICKKIVEAHDGRIEESSPPGGGAGFLLTFPKRRGSVGARS
jgi:two-component system sensor histidine kinase HydH